MEQERAEEPGGEMGWGKWGERRTGGEDAPGEEYGKGRQTEKLIEDD